MEQTILGNRYQIIKKIGDGGMAFVYQAKDKLLNRIVAVKVLRPEFVDDKDFLAKFKREAEAVANITHPNIVNVYDVGQEGKVHYIVMEYVDGQNLKEIIKNEGVLDEYTALDITKQIAQALSAAHKKGVIHRDIKPHNILISNEDRQVKVADFGIAKAVSNSTITNIGSIIGSVHYFSPEQAKGQPVANNADLYSLGIVLYEMLIGRVPFRGDSPISIALQHINEEIEFTQEEKTKIPHSIRTLISKMTEKSPEDRYQSAEEVIEDIDYIEKNIDNQKLKELKNIKQDLINNNKLHIDSLFQTYIQDKNIIIYDYPLDKELNFIASSYHATIVNQQYLPKTHHIHKFPTVNEEISYICEQIRTLIDSNIDINNIYLILPNDYQTITQTTFKLYNIPINLSSPNKMISYSLVKDFLKDLKQTKDITSSLQSIQDNYNLKEEETLNIYNTMINIINKINLNKIEDIITILEEQLKTKTITPKKLKNAINIATLNNTFKETDYIFILGFNSNNYPNITKDIDYLPDTLKKEVGLTTSYEYNKINKTHLINKLNEINNLNLSYSTKNNQINYFKSPLEEELQMIPITTHELKYTYSNLYNKISLASKLDDYNSYKIKNNSLDTLYNTYPSIPYLTYDNTYHTIDKTSLYSYLHNKLYLSYSSLNNYYKCSFRYYIENILKLSSKEKTFDLYIGNLFHYILSICFQDDFDYDTSFENYINTHDPLTKKEQIFITKLKQELLYIITYIKESLDYTTFDKINCEEKISLNIEGKMNVTITGIIDKVMYKEENNHTYLVVIDYKTGNPDINLNNTIYGINMQLPMYLYLLKEKGDLKEIEVSGFYYQKILNSELNFKEGKTKEEQKNETLKLIGYSNSNPEILEKFDKTYQNSRIIKSLKLTSNGFSKHAKLLNTNQIDKLIDLCKNNIEASITSIENADFKINPKVIKDDYIGCKFCPYNDICYKTYADYVMLEEQKDLEFLN